MCSHSLNYGEDCGSCKAVRNSALEDAAKVVDGWHIKKGGYGALAEEIRSKKA